MKYVHIRHHSAANYTDIPGKDPKAHSRVGCYCHRMNAQSPLKSERAKPNIFFTRLLLLVCPMLAGPHKKRETRDASTAVLLRSTIYARSHTTIPQPVTPLLQRLSSTHARSTTLLCDRLHPSSAFAGGHRLWTCSPCDSTCVRSDTHRDRSITACGKSVTPAALSPAPAPPAFGRGTRTACTSGVRVLEGVSSRRSVAFVVGRDARPFAWPLLRQPRPGSHARRGCRSTGHANGCTSSRTANTTIRYEVVLSTSRMSDAQTVWVSRAQVVRASNAQVGAAAESGGGAVQAGVQPA